MVDDTLPADEEELLEEVELPETEAVMSFEEIAGQPEPDTELPATAPEEIPEEELPPELREAPPFVPRAEPEAEAVDFSTLPPADVQIPITPGKTSTGFRSITLRENGDPVVVDFVRTGPTDGSLSLRMEEVGFSGNRSPWRTGQYEISNGGIIEFPAGQNRARVELTMADDSLREADQQSTLRIRDQEAASDELATIEVNLEDDDQRQFESQLPTNTIAFAVSQVSVSRTRPRGAGRPGSIQSRQHVAQCRFHGQRRDRNGWRGLFPARTHDRLLRTGPALRASPDSARAGRGL